jgi:tetratricopeptide (TPR) repeat protein
MAATLICPHGHQWEVSDESLSIAGTQAIACPLCGALAVSRSAVEPCADSAVSAFPTRITASTPPQVDFSLALTPDLPSIPGYEVLGRLGHGGMGVVYKARQLRLNRLVALKMIAAGAHASPERLARFQIEAEALASLQHPHIVQIYEVGEWDRCPYIALEFVDGPSLDNHLAGAPQPLRAAAQLVETLARAMHSAHQRGIVHRDLKPANILLAFSREPLASADVPLAATSALARGVTCGSRLNVYVPKITDFGLAKRLEEDSHTRPGAIMGTPCYMAPEQAEGNLQDMGPLTDVYALGAILYEMLTGRPPFEGPSPLAVLQQVRGNEPVPPSRRQPRVPRDLETICLKCLQKKPAQRYPSALALAEDLHRFLADEPISARPVGAGERLVKWVRRRPALAALLLVSILAAAALVTLGIWSYAALHAAAERERKQLRITRRAVDEMYSQVAEEWLAIEPHKDAVQRAFLVKALRIYQQLAQEESDDPAVREDTGRAYYRVARISLDLGQWARADRAFARALAIQQQLPLQFPNLPVYQQELAESYNWLGELRRRSRQPLREAEEVYRKALEVQEQLVRQYPKNPAYLADKARTYYNLGIVHMDTSQRRQAQEDYEQAISCLQKATAQAPREPRYHEELARTLINRGNLFEESGDSERSEADFQQAIKLLQGLVQDDHAKPIYRCELGVTYTNLGNLLFHQKRYREAEDACHEAIARLEPLWKAFPDRPLYRYELSNAQNSLGAVLAKADKRKQAGEHWLQARDLLTRLSEQFPDAVSYRYGLGQTLGNLGWLDLQQGRLEEARASLEQAIHHLEALLRPNPENPTYQRALRDQCENLAQTLVRLGDDAAIERQAEALAQALPKGQGPFLAAGFLAACATAVSATAESNPRAQHYSELALKRLRQAIQAGFSDRQRFQTDPSLASLRQLPEFQELLEQVPAR